MNAQDRSDVEELAAALPPCSQCGKRLTERACGPSHALLAANPLQHRLIVPLVERDLAERDARVAREAKREALTEAEFEIRDAASIPIAGRAAICAVLRGRVRALADDPREDNRG